MYDFVVVGGGPAGTQAALTLALQDFRIAVIDSNRPRNAAAIEVRGFLSLLPTPAHKFRQICRDSLFLHKNIDFLFARVIDIEQEPHKGRYSVRFVRGAIEESIFGKYILIATGLREVLPQISNFRAFYGSAIQSCLWCYAFEVRDKRVGLFATEYDEESVLELTKYARRLGRLSKEVKVFVPSGMTDLLLGSECRVVGEVPVSVLQSADGRTFAGLETESEKHLLDLAFVLPKYSAGGEVLDSLGVHLKNGEYIARCDGARVGESGTQGGVFAAGECCTGPANLAASAGDGARVALAAALAF